MLDELQVEGSVLLNQDILPCLWRAPTDNDKGGGQNSYASKWKAALLDTLSFRTEHCSIQKLTDYGVHITTAYVGIPLKSGDDNLILCTIDVSYWIYGSGDVIIEYNINPRKDLPPLPRVGVEFHLDQSLDQVTWYGKGPFECYPDRKEAAHVGIYESNVEGMHVPYIVPGECSGRADVRWVAFRNKGGHGLFASIYGASPPMQMSASYYGTAELDRATHNHELVKGDNIEVLFCFHLIVCA